MAKTPRSSLFLSEPWCASGSYLCLKGIPIMYSVQEVSDLTWDVLLCIIGEYQHRVSSYNQGQNDISQTSQTRVCKLNGCRGYSTQWKDSSPYASWFRKATLTSCLTRLLLQLWGKCQWAASFSLSPGSFHRCSISQKEHQICISLGRTLREHEKSFFSLSGTSSTEPVHITRVKLPIHNLSPQVFGSFWVQQVKQPLEGTAAPMPLC